MHGSDYCFIHNPEQKKAREKALKKGGQALKKVKMNLAPVKFEGGTRDVADLLAETINQVRQNRISQRTANTIGYLANILLKALESGEIEERLEKIERVILEKRTYSK